VGGDFGFNTAPMMVIGVIILSGTAIRSFWQKEFSKSAILFQGHPGGRIQSKLGTRMRPSPSGISTDLARAEPPHQCAAPPGIAYVPQV
jgi:hypothetical protein